MLCSVKVCEGPRYCKYRNVPRGVEVEFSDVAVGLKTREGSKRIRAFSVAGSDREFAWAEAEILGPSIILVRKPAGFSAIESVRYDWGDTPDGNLCSSAGLPAEPFRTDNWPGLTTGKR